VLVYCRVGVLSCWCIVMLVVLSCWCIVVLVYCPVGALLCWCIVVLVYCRVGVLSCWCIVGCTYLIYLNTFSNCLVVVLLCCWMYIPDLPTYLEGKGKLNTSVKFWNDLCWVMWQRGNDPTKVLYNCRIIVQLQFNFTTAKKFHNCNILRRNNTKKSQLLFHFTTAKKLYNCKTNAQQQKNVQLRNKFIAILIRRHLQDILRGKS
jgi:hypothetical protein